MLDQVSDCPIKSSETAMTDRTTSRIIVRIRATPFSFLVAITPRFLDNRKLHRAYCKVYVKRLSKTLEGIGWARVYPLGALANSHASNTLRGAMFSSAFVSVWYWPVFASLFWVCTVSVTATLMTNVSITCPPLIVT